MNKPDNVRLGYDDANFCFEVVNGVMTNIFNAMSAVNAAINKAMGGGISPKAQEVRPLNAAQRSAWDQDIARRNEIAQWI